MNDRPWYDNKDGIATKLRTLGDFNELIRARKEAPEKQFLREWIVLGRFWLDNYGQVWIFTEGAPTQIYEYIGMSYEQAHGVFPREELTCSVRTVATPFWLPTESNRCAHCGKGWELRNAHDIYKYRYDGQAFHNSCRRLFVIQRDYEQLSSMLVLVGIVGKIKLIPSQYHSDDSFFGPWLLCETRRGKLIIGWRKRVLEIDWSDTDITIESKEVTTDDVTKGEKYIHAWNEAKAIEYLHMIWNGE